MLQACPELSVAVKVRHIAVEAYKSQGEYSHSVGATKRNAKAIDLSFWDCVDRGKGRPRLELNGLPA